MNKKGNKVRRTKDDMDKVFVDPPTAEEYWKLQKKLDQVLEENDRLRCSLIRMHEMYDAYYKKEKEVKHCCESVDPGFLKEAHDCNDPGFVKEIHDCECVDPGFFKEI